MTRLPGVAKMQTARLPIAIESDPDAAVRLWVLPHDIVLLTDDAHFTTIAQMARA
jgi:hypothetical protein